MGGSANKGVAFALVPNGASWLYQVIYSFCSQSQCADGASPTSGLIERRTSTARPPTTPRTIARCSSSPSAAASSSPVADGSGNLFGTTYQGGNGGGVIYEITP